MKLKIIHIIGVKLACFGGAGGRLDPLFLADVGREGALKVESDTTL